MLQLQCVKKALFEYFVIADVLTPGSLWFPSHVQLDDNSSKYINQENKNYVLPIHSSIS